MAIAAFPTATRGLLPAALRSLQDHHPLLSVESHEREPAKAVPLLVRGAVDVVIVDEWFHDEPTPPPGVEMTHLLDDVADLALPAGHELTSSGAAVDLSGCAHEQWISWTAGEFGHDWLRAALVEHHPGLRLTHTAGEHQTILALVAAGLGMALMPRLGGGRRRRGWRSGSYSPRSPGASSPCGAPTPHSGRPSVQRSRRSPPLRAQDDTGVVEGRVEVGGEA